jgi:hypothetical protein
MIIKSCLLHRPASLQQVVEALVAGDGVTPATGLGLAFCLPWRRGQALPFAYPRRNVPAWPVHCASNSPAPSTTSPRVETGARTSSSTKRIAMLLEILGQALAQDIQARERNAKIARRMTSLRGLGGGSYSTVPLEARRAVASKRLLCRDSFNGQVAHIRPLTGVLESDRADIAVRVHVENGVFVEVFRFGYILFAELNV